MPIKLDLEECKQMNELLAYLITEKHQLVLGENFQNLPRIVEMVGEQLHDIYMTKETIEQMGKILADMAKSPEMKKVFDKTLKKLDQTSRKRVKKAINEAN